MWGLRHVAVILVCECVFPQIVQILSKVPEVYGKCNFSLGEQDISTKGRFAAPFWRGWVDFLLLIFGPVLLSGSTSLQIGSMCKF